MRRKAVARFPEKIMLPNELVWKAAPMPLRDVKLEDKYDLGHTHVFVTGFQALVRLCLMQKELDRRNGLNTAGYVSGYRGSPLGGLDTQFQRAAAFLKKSVKSASPSTRSPCRVL